MDAKEKERVVNLVKGAVHSRARIFTDTLKGKPGYITFYGKDHSSPSGVVRTGSCPLTDEYEELIRKTDDRISPLPPDHFKY